MQALGNSAIIFYLIYSSGAHVRIQFNYIKGYADGFAFHMVLFIFIIRHFKYSLSSAENS